ncbi:hypothetical protein [Streptomyces sp. NPDC057910]|uniref:hypothetical protein n=1 Tax=Streptomyces sp. NPDC057910 TaxID=3346278 RepID=UPI0036E5F56C
MLKAGSMFRRPWTGLRAPIGAVLCVLVTSACGLVPEHPAAGKAVTMGMRITASQIEIKVPLCPGARISRVEVWKPSDGKGGEEQLWWGNAPQQGSEPGVVRLWSNVGYASASPARRPSTLLPAIDISVDYSGESDGVGSILDTRQAAGPDLQPGQYWSMRNKPMTGKEIDEQLSCNKTKPPSSGG